MDGLVNAVEIPGAGFECEGLFRARFDVRLKVVVSRLARVNRVERDVRRVHRLVAGLHVVRPAGTMRHQMDDAQRLGARLDFVAVAPRKLGHAGDVL